MAPPHVSRLLRVLPTPRSALGPVQAAGLERLRGAVPETATRPLQLPPAQDPASAGTRSGAEQRRHVAARCPHSSSGRSPQPLMRSGPCSVEVSRSRGHGAVSRGFAAQTDETGTSASLKKLVYRAQQRGILELDLLVGTWAQRHAASLSPAHVKDLAALLDEESPDLLKWMLGQLAPPDHVASNEVFKALRADVEGRLGAHSHPRSYAHPGADWVKGWGDIGRPGPTFVPAPPAGNQ